jgi:hypothetical protein
LLALNRRKLGPQLGDAIADLAPVELQRGLARAAAGLAFFARRRLAQARRGIRQARDLDLQARLAALGVAVEDLDDHAGAIEHLRARGALQVPGLARREVVVHGHQRHLRLGHLVGLVVLRRRALLPASPGLADLPQRQRGAALAGAAGQLGELGQLALAQHRGRGQVVAGLGHAPRDPVAQGLHQPAKLGEARVELGLAHLRQPDRDQYGVAAVTGGHLASPCALLRPGEPAARRFLRGQPRGAAC